MSEELIQKKLTKNGLLIGNYQYYNIGNTTLNQLKQHNIIPKNNYDKYSKRKPDALLVDRTNKSNPIVICVIEYKNIGKFQSKKDKIKTLEQCNDVAQVLNAKIGIATDGEQFIWFNPNHKNKSTEYKDKTTKILRSYTIIENENGLPFTQNFIIDQKQNELEVYKLTDMTRDTYTSVNNISVAISENTSVIAPFKTIDPLPLAKNVWQDIWIATGKTPEKCLYNVVEILIFKFLSDLGILKDPENFEYLFSLYKKISAEEVLDYYAKNCRAKIYKLFPVSSTDNTTIINGTIFVDGNGNANLTQATLFENSIKKFRDFEDKFGKLTNIDKEFKTKLYETFLKQTQGLKGLGQYFTPRKVVRAIVKMSDINNLTAGSRVCDPFCGVGGFILEPINLFDNLRKDFAPKNGKINTKIKYEGFDKGAEKDEERTIILAKANMLIYLADIIVKYGHLTKEFSQTFNNTFHLLKSNLGTLNIIKDKEEEKYNLILTNPPYVTKGKKSLLNEIRKDADLKRLFKINAIGVEGLALEWIIYSLKRGGSAFIIVPDGLLNRISDKKLRKYILKECFINAIVSLPRKTFFATSKKTYILSITKKDNPEDEQSSPVFTYLIKDIGERLDVTRFNIIDDDLNPMVDLYNQFKGSKNNFSTKDPKCKIKGIKTFHTEPSWIIDRWWSEEERQKLGIKDATQVLNLVEFRTKLSEMQDNLKNAILELKHINESKKNKFIEIEVKDLFDFDIKTNRSNFTRAFVNQNKGDIPVYSASKDSDFTGYGRIKNNLNGIKYFENCLTWNIDGYIGKAFYRKGRFTLSEKVIPLVLRDQYTNNVSYEYVKYILQKEAAKRELGFSNKAGKSRIADIKINLPIKKSGNKSIIDIQKQAELADKYRKVAEIQENFITEIELLKTLTVELT